MKPSRLLLAVVVITLSKVAFAQSDAQKAFDGLKTLEGSWEATMMTDPPEPSVEGKLVQVSFRVASLGNVLMHDMRVAGRPDNPLTMLYRDGDGLQLTHYCDAGNRPRMTGKISPDGKTVEFDFLDLAGSDQHGHMHRARFTLVDQDRHIEEWVWMPPGEKPLTVHLELRRK